MASNGRDVTVSALPGAFVTPYVAHINHMFRSCYCSIYKAFHLVTSDTGLITSLEKWFFYRHDEKRPKPCDRILVGRSYKTIFIETFDFKVFRGKLSVEIEFSSLDEISEWLTLNQLDENSDGLPTMVNVHDF